MSDDARMVKARKNFLRGAVALYLLWVGFLLMLVTVSSVKPPTNPSFEAKP